ncbi:DUF6090 family protein [Sungkyunkwania multivorans]|uniref:DUF6090 family protein n=1 Tax=Sungkyunkwania multivorans TaxID=1173618 RepID=A0ABW3D2E6_9FLAO
MKKINWRYALGEILIVIIGISIAFSLNKCSEDKKDAALRNNYIKNLRSDIAADRQNLQENITALEKFQQTSREITPHLTTNSNQKMGILGKIFEVSQSIEFLPQDFTFQTLVNSGDFKLIGDFELKTDIQKYYSYDIPEILRAYKRQETIHKEYLGRYYIYNADFDKMSKGEFPFDDEQLLKRIIQSLSASCGIQQKASEKGVAVCDSLITKLDDTLNKY